MVDCPIKNILKPLFWPQGFSAINTVGAGAHLLRQLMRDDSARQLPSEAGATGVEGETQNHPWTEATLPQGMECGSDGIWIHSL